jgi:hypothetical protein
MTVVREAAELPEAIDEVTHTGNPSPGGAGGPKDRHRADASATADETTCKLVREATRA